MTAALASKGKRINLTWIKLGILEAKTGNAFSSGAEPQGVLAWMMDMVDGYG